MGRDNDDWYQCKLCNGTFKTTAELQKHKRLNHRSVVSSGNTNCSPSSDNSCVRNLNPDTEAVEQSTASKIRSRNDVGVNPSTGHSHGTRYSKAKNHDRDDTMLRQGERHLTCASCSQNFDTKDPVVLHLLRQSRTDRGTLKCPFCSKKLQEESELHATSASEETVKDAESLKDVSSTVGVTGTRSRAKCHQSNVQRGTDEDLGKDKATKGRSSLVDVAKGNKKRQMSPNSEMPSTPMDKQRLPKMRKLHPQSVKNVHVDNSATPGENESSDSQSSVVYASKSAAILPAPNLSASTPFFPMQSELKRDYEVTYRKSCVQGSRGSIGGRRTSNTKSRSDQNGMNADDNSRNSMDAPLMVSVLINNNPYPSATRLAVPKGKNFEKGNIKCPYCGFEAKAVRELQFHVNTHLAKSYPCEFCSHIYRSKQAVMNHTEKYHANALGNTEACSINVNYGGGEKDGDDDQRSMSNYSNSLTSDSMETENYGNVSQSQETRMENSFPVTATDTSYYSPGIKYENFTNDQHHAYYSSSVSTLLISQAKGRELVMMDGGVAGGRIEKVVEMANF